MDKPALKDTAQKLVDKKRGIFAADWSSGTITKKFASVGLESNPEHNRRYRQMLITTSGLEEFISAAIFHDETVRQKVNKKVPFPVYADKKGIIPGIRVDEGKQPFSESPKEQITKGIKSLSKKLKEYKKMGLKFTKWRGVVLIGKGLPTRQAVKENAKLMAKFAIISQKNGFVPIVEPDVLRNGDHGISKCEEVTRYVLSEVFSHLEKEKVRFEEMVLKTNMVTSGKDAKRDNPRKVAKATLRVVKRAVFEKVPGIVFLSGGQEAGQATTNLNEINKLNKDAPWELSFSYARALQMPALNVWKGKDANVKMAQEAFYHRAKMNSLARQGLYKPEMEGGKNGE